MFRSLVHAREALAAWRADYNGERPHTREVTLPWLLHKFGEVLQKTIKTRGQILLEKR